MGTIGSEFARSAEIRARNPVFNENAVKLAVFCPNAPGAAKTLAPERLVPRWEDSRAICEFADRAGIEAVVGVSRWKSLVAGKPEDISGYILEPVVWAAAMAVATRRTAIFATVHMAAFAPAVAAKQAATIDQISGGRLGLNLVAGWNRGEAELLGVRFAEHDERYSQAAEWTEIVQRLWVSEDEFDFRGRFYELKGAHLAPRPAQVPGPVLMNAGGSERGRDFCAGYAEIGLITVNSEDPGEIAAQVASYRRLAAAKGRELQVWTPVAIIQGDSDADAVRMRERIDALGDYEAARTQVEGLKAAWNLDEGAQRRLTRRIVEGGGGWPAVGSAQTVADRLEMLSRAGLDGVLVSWIDFSAGLTRLVQDVLPILERRGLREPNQRSPDSHVMVVDNPQLHFNQTDEWD